MKPKCVTIHMKAIEQYFHVVLFIMLYKVVLSFESVDENLVCDHWNESYWAVLSRSAVYFGQLFSKWNSYFYLSTLGSERVKVVPVVLQIKKVIWKWLFPSEISIMIHHVLTRNYGHCSGLSGLTNSIRQQKLKQVVYIHFILVHEWSNILLQLLDSQTCKWNEMKEFNFMTTRNNTIWIKPRTPIPSTLRRVMLLASLN